MASAMYDGTDPMPHPYRNRVKYSNRAMLALWQRLQDDAARIVADVRGVVPSALAQHREMVRAELERRHLAA